MTEVEEGGIERQKSLGLEANQKMCLLMTLRLPGYIVLSYIV